MNAQKPPTHLNEGQIRVALADPDTPGLVLLTIALWTFGDQVFGNREAGVEKMDAAEMWAAFNERYNTWVTEEGENKLNAMITGLQSAAFWEDIEVFQAVCMALFDGDIGDIVNNVFNELSALEIMWAVIEMDMAWDEKTTPDFAPAIRDLIERTIASEASEQKEDMVEIEQTYRMMLKQLRKLDVPVDTIRIWEQDYEDVVEAIENNDIS
jgi:hypothetical protein